MDWYSVDLGNGVVWLPKNRCLYDDVLYPNPELVKPEWIALHSLWMYYVPSTGEVINLAYFENAGDGSRAFQPVFKSLSHLVASFAVFDGYWRSLPQFWQDSVLGTIAFQDPDNDSDEDDPRQTFDSIVMPVLRKCLPVWCEINPETADALTFFYEEWLVDVDINPYAGADFSDPDLPEGAVLWDSVAASLMPERRY
jgi:hypothetical protein